MARARSPNRDKAFVLYKESKGTKPLVDIAAELGVSDSQIRKWKSQDKWDERLNSNVTISKGSVTHKQIKSKVTKVIEKLEDADLTEKQRLFCLYYVKSFNATMAAIKAGYSKERAHVTGSELVRNSKVAAEIKRLKGAMQQKVFIDAMDVLNKYIKIAFADITDFADFGTKIVVDEEDGATEVAYVDVKNSSDIDGSIVQEVKQGKEGVSIKLHDKMKALEKLEKYFDLLPDHHKQKLEEEKIVLAKQKHELDKRIVELREREEQTKGW